MTFHTQDHVCLTLLEYLLYSTKCALNAELGHQVSSIIGSKWLIKFKEILCCKCIYRVYKHIFARDFSPIQGNVSPTPKQYTKNPKIVHIKKVICFFVHNLEKKL